MYWAFAREPGLLPREATSRGSEELSEGLVISTLQRLQVRRASEA